MDRSSLRLVNTILVVLITFAVLGCSQAIPKWEYKTETVSVADRDQTLSVRGKEGWELVSSQIHQKSSQADIDAIEAKISDFPTKIQICINPALEATSNAPSTRNVAEANIALMQNVGEDPRKVQAVINLMSESNKELKAALRTSDHTIAVNVSYYQIREAIEECEAYLKILQQKKEAKSEVVDLSFKRKSE